LLFVIGNRKEVLELLLAADEMQLGELIKHDNG